MAHLRGTLLWLCTVSLALAGVMGHGLVLCVRADGATTIEPVSGDGRCFDDGVAYSAAADDRGGILFHRQSTDCHNLAIADSLSRISSAAPEWSLASSPPVLLTMTVLPTASSERTLRSPRHHPPTYFVTDVAAVRRTVSLLV